MGSNAYQTAFKLLTLGFSVIPSGSGDKGKAPLVDWRGFQDNPADANQLQNWGNQLEPSLWGIVTNSRVAVIDADTPATRAELTAELGEPHVITPRGGAHWYIDSTGHPLKTVVGLLPGVDVRGVGGFVNIAGGKYQILRLPVPGDTLLPYNTLPKRILAALDESKPAQKVRQGAPIPETKRNATLTSIAGAMRRKGADQDAIEAALLTINSQQCKPPLPEREVLTIAGSVSRYEPQPDTDQPAYFNLTDYGNAERLVSLYGHKIRYSPERKAWLLWTGKTWELDLGSVGIAKLAKRTARNIYGEAADEPDDDLRKELVKHARATERQVRLDAMIRSAESEPGVAIGMADMDTNHWLLNVNNGTIDLRTGALKPHDPADLITEILPIDYDPDAVSSEWATFLNRIFNNDSDLIAYVQRGMGYSATGDQSEQVFFFCYGSGWNGKSTLLNAVRLVLGNYATQVPPTAFMVDTRKRGGPDEAIASLQNKRLVCSTELEHGQRLSVSLVKRMTGGEPLWCEHKFEHGYNFQPSHKLWLSGNHEPTITDTTNSIWYRLKKIPFTIEIPEGDRKKGYAEYLAREHNRAILAWLVQGCVDWQQSGSLGEPEVVKQAVAQYRDQEDILHDFLEDCCVVEPLVTIPKSSLKDEYHKWCHDNSVDPITQRTFKAGLIEKGFGEGRIGSARYWRGIRLRTDADGDISGDKSDKTLDDLALGVTKGNQFSEGSYMREKQKILMENSVTDVTNVTDDTKRGEDSNDPWSGMPDYPHEPCHTCGGSDFWPDFKGKRFVCGRCHPKPQEIDMEV